MDEENEIKKRREALNLSQARLAELAGTNQQTIDRIENGAHSRALPRVLAALEIEPPTTGIVAARGVTKRGGDLPIYAAAEGGLGEMVRSYEPIDYQQRPAPLANVRDAYGMYIIGASMSPAFEGNCVLDKYDR